MKTYEVLVCQYHRTYILKVIDGTYLLVKGFALKIWNFPNFSININWIGRKVFSESSNLYYCRIIGADCQTSKGHWHKESSYLRFIQGFFQAAPQLVLQSVILTKGIMIHSLRELVDIVQGLIL